RPAALPRGARHHAWTVRRDRIASAVRRSHRASRRPHDAIDRSRTRTTDSRIAIAYGMLAALVAALAFQHIDSTPPHRPPRTIAVDERLAADGGVRLGDQLIVSRSPGGAGDTVVVSAFVRRGADPSEVARAEYRVRMHLGELQSLIDYGDRVDRFALSSTTTALTDSAVRAINAAAFGFQAYRSRDIA